MKAFNIIGIVLVIILVIVCGYYIEEVSSARWRSYDFYDFGGSYNYYGRSAADLTMEAGLIMLIFVLIYAGLYISNIVKVKTTTTKVLTIIGMSFTFIMLCWTGLMLSSPGGISFDEVGPVYILWGIINLAFTIVLLVQAVKYDNKKNGLRNQQDVLDVEIE
jgi:hypothetical protein